MRVHSLLHSACRLSSSVARHRHILYGTALYRSHSGSKCIQLGTFTDIHSKPSTALARSEGRADERRDPCLGIFARAGSREWAKSTNASPSGRLPNPRQPPCYSHTVVTGPVPYVINKPLRPSPHRPAHYILVDIALNLHQTRVARPSLPAPPPVTWPGTRNKACMYLIHVPVIRLQYQDVPHRRYGRRMLS